jgi:hypothetical protein
MARLSFKQILLAIAVGAVFASLQGDPPLPALKMLAPVACKVDQNTHC